MSRHGLTLSGAMCTYNGSRHLAAQLESLAAQERPLDELVVCDDSSSDETTDIVRAFAARAPFEVRLEVNRSRLGSTRNFERAISLCDGDIIFLADQDDVWSPRKTAVYETHFERYPCVELLFSDARLVDDDGGRLPGTAWQALNWTARERQALDGLAAVYETLRRPVVTGATVALRRRMLGVALPFPDSIVERPPVMLHDGWLAAVAAGSGALAFTDEPLIFYRRHRGQQVGLPTGRTSRKRSSAAGPADRHGEVAWLDRALRIVAVLEDRLPTARVRYAHEQLLVAREHALARQALPAARRSRLGPVLVQLRRGHYHRYSRGIFSAIKDIAS